MPTRAGGIAVSAVAGQGNLRVLRPLMPGREHDMIEAGFARLAAAGADGKAHGIGLAHGIDDAAARAYIDRDALTARAFEQRLELVVEIFAKGEPWIEGPFTDLGGVDSQIHEAARRLRIQPLDKRFFKRRYLDTRDIRKHRGVVPAGAIRRSTARRGLRFENRQREGPRLPVQ